MTVLVLRWRQITPIRTRWRGPSFAPEAIPPDTPVSIAAIVGPPGGKGNPGDKGDPGPTGPSGSDDVGTFVAGASMPKGTPIYISRVNAQIYPADAAFYTKSAVIGTTLATVAAGFPVDVGRATQYLADWTAIAGSVSLLPGQSYFLAPGGGITTVPPSKPSAAAVAFLGTAISAQSLDVHPLSPIAL